MIDTTQDLENIGKALALLRAYRHNLRGPDHEDLAELGMALLRYVALNADLETRSAQFGELIRGHAILSNTLIEAVALSSGRSADDTLEDYEDQVLEMIARRERASGSLRTCVPMLTSSRDIGSG